MEFLEKAENKFRNLRPIGSDIETVKDQIKQLNDFKTEVDPQMVKVEALNRYNSPTIYPPIRFTNWRLFSKP